MPERNPDQSKCRYCKGMIADRDSAYILSFLSRRGDGFIAFAFCCLTCLLQWSKIEAKSK